MPSRAQDTAPAPPKVFNCIVDDTALVQGAKKSTRDGIPKWIAAGQIRIFVPLYSVYTPLDIICDAMTYRLPATDSRVALNQTSRIKDIKGRIASDAEEALFWLDDATTSSPHLVTLQGGFEKFEDWAQVQKFALPKTLFSETDVHDESAFGDDLVEQAESKLHIDDEYQPRHSFSSNESFASQLSAPSEASMRSGSPLSPPTSPLKKNTTMNGHENGQNQKDETSSDKADNDTTGIPAGLRPLFNYILWRIHQEIDPIAALESFIFLCDDPKKRRYAQKFGVRTKSLADIRYAIAREGQETRNRQIVQKKEAAKHIRSASGNVNPTQAIKQTPSISGSPSLVNVKPVQVSDSVSANGQEDSDEDEIVLKRPPKAPAAMLAANAPSGRGKVLDPNQFSRNVSNPTRGAPRGGVRGGGSRNVSRGGFASRGTPNKQENNGPIDPNSFTRPNSGRGGQRGGRRLWMPT